MEMHESRLKWKTKFLSFISRFGVFFSKLTLFIWREEQDAGDWESRELPAEIVVGGVDRGERDVGREDGRQQVGHGVERVGGAGAETAGTWKRKRILILTA